jgi:hypothetical protein
MQDKIIVVENENEFTLSIPDQGLIEVNSDLFAGYKKIISRQKELTKNLEELGICLANQNKIKQKRMRLYKIMIGGLIIFYILFSPFYIVSKLGGKIDRALNVDRGKEQARVLRLRAFLDRMDPYLREIRKALNSNE